MLSLAMKFDSFGAILRIIGEKYKLVIKLNFVGFAHAYGINSQFDC